MNILYHHRTQGKGVEKVHIMGIVEAWCEQGHNVDMVSPPGVPLEDTTDESRQDRATRRGIWQHSLKYMPEFVFEFLEFFYNVWAYKSIIKKVKSKPYDLIFERYSFLCFAAMMVAKRNNIPFFLEVNFTSDTPIVRKRSRLIRNLERVIEKKIFEDADGIVVVSTYLKSLLLSTGVSEEKVIVLPNAADPNKFDPTMNTDKVKKELKIEDKKVVGFVGYFYSWHGVELLVETFEHVRSSIDDIVYLLVGDGPIFESIQKKIFEQSLEKEILLVGRVPHKRVPEYVASFDIAVMPHSNNYGSPMKILEYMAMGKAVVAPHIGPIEDIIEDGVNGLLFEPRNVKSLQKQLVKLLSDKAFRKNLGQAARDSIVEEHNWLKNASMIITLYKNILYKTKEINRI